LRVGSCIILCPRYSTLDTQFSVLGVRAWSSVCAQVRSRRSSLKRAVTRRAVPERRQEKGRKAARSSSKALSGSANRIAENKDTAYPHRTHVSNTSKNSVIGCPIAQPMRTSTGRMHSDTWIDEPTAIDMERLSLSLTETVTAVTCSTELPGTGSWDQLGSLRRRMRRSFHMRKRRSVLPRKRVEDRRSGIVVRGWRMEDGGRRMEDGAKLRTTVSGIENSTRTVVTVPLTDNGK
jgi:hypothetical protein